MKYQKLNKKDLSGDYKLKVDLKKSELACMQCLPPAPLNGHAYLNGVMIHSRIDCEPEVLYMIREEDFKV